MLNVPFALSHRTQFVGIVEHAGQWHFGVDDADAAVDFGTGHQAALAGKVPGDLPLIFVRNFDFQLHDRFLQRHVGLAQRFTHTADARDLERHFR